MKTTTLLLSITCILVQCKGGQLTTDNQGITIVKVSDIEWTDLNPARGANSPRAGALWGSRTGAGPAGFLLKPVDGFKSPPHFHTARYHGVVIKGSIHNDKPENKEVYLKPGSFWIQPAGGIHITAAKGRSLAYIEVEDAFDVKPVKDAPKDAGDPSNVPSTAIQWQPEPNGAQTALLWGSLDHQQPAGSLLKMPPGAKLKLNTSAATILRAVIIQGSTKIGASSLEPGSYFGTVGKSTTGLFCKSSRDCILYHRTQGEFTFVKPTTP